MAMKRLYIALSLLAAAATVHADGSLTSAAVEEGGVAWSIEGVASGILSDDAAIVAQGFVVLRPGDMGGVSEIVSDGEKIEIEIKTTNTSAVIGRRGEVLDAIQCIAGAVANIGREEYRRVVVDCENYRAQREEKLKDVAVAKAAKAVEKKRRVALEPMSPYERRVVHSVLADNEEVTTVSEGKEPMRRVVIIPKNEVPFERKEKRGRQFNRDKRDGDRGERKFGDRRERRFDRRNGEKRDRGERFNRSDRPERSERPARPPRSSAPKGKKQIYLGTFLGNSGAGKEEKKDENKGE